MLPKTLPQVSNGNQARIIYGKTLCATCYHKTLHQLASSIDKVAIEEMANLEPKTLSLFSSLFLVISGQVLVPLSIMGLKRVSVS